MLSAKEIASMSAVVAASLDVTLTVSRDTSKVLDTYGHTTSGGTTSFTAQVNVYKPNAPQLQMYADIIGTQEAYMLRFAQTTDFRCLCKPEHIRLLCAYDVCIHLQLWRIWLVDIHLSSKAGCTA